MTIGFTKLVTAAAAAAFLTLTPVHAQNSSGSVGGGAADVYPSQDMDERVSPNKDRMRETFRGLGTQAPATDVTFNPTIGATVPETIIRGPVPQEIVEISPETAGYEYFTLPDGRIVLVHPEAHTVATIIE